MRCWIVGTGMPEQLRALNTRHRRAIDMIMLGHGNKRIAQELDVKPATVSLWRNDPIFQTEIAKRRDSATDECRRILEVGARQAALTMVAACSPGTSKREGISPLNLRAAQALLDRIGLVPADAVVIEKAMTEQEARDVIAAYPEHILRAALAMKEQQ